MKTNLKMKTALEEDELKNKDGLHIDGMHMALDIFSCAVALEMVSVSEWVSQCIVIFFV